jgi:CheY-like chemotaxis protein
MGNPTALPSSPRPYRAPGPHTASAGLLGRRALVVDDDAQVLELVASMLEELGCETLLARSGTEALGTIANDQTIDVLVADITMPGLAGSALAERARSFRPDPGSNPVDRRRGR